jgi:hypothetical protein
MGLCSFHATNNGLRHSDQMSFRHLKHATELLQTPLDQANANLAAAESATIADSISSPP